MSVREIQDITERAGELLENARRRSQRSLWLLLAIVALLVATAWVLYQGGQYRNQALEYLKEAKKNLASAEELRASAVERLALAEEALTGVENQFPEAVERARSSTSSSMADTTKGELLTSRFGEIRRSFSDVVETLEEQSARLTSLEGKWWHHLTGFVYGVIISLVAALLFEKLRRYRWFVSQK